MTFRVDGVDVMQAIEIASVVGSIVAMLVLGLIVYLMVRPSRRRNQVRPPEEEPFDAGELLRLMDRMEQRLKVLERVVRDEPRIEDTLLETGEQRPEMRRKK